VVFTIGLLGLGTVGTGTAEIILDSEGRNPLLREIKIKQVGVSNLDKPRSVPLEPGVLTTDLESIVNDPEIEIVVELIGGLEPARSLILTAISNGKHIVTANKAVIARYGDEIYTAANQAGVYVLLEAAVAGGIPVIKPLKQSLGVNRITSVIGMIAFGERVKREEISCEGIRQISATDINYAENLGFVIKLLAIAKGGMGKPLQIRVHPTLVSQDHPLANVNNVNNAVLVEGEPLGQVMLFGPGAGKGATASAVVSDIVNVAGLLKSNTQGKNLDPHLSCPHKSYAQLLPLTEITTRFYTRFLCNDVPGVIGYLGTCFGKHDVSLESIVQIGFQEDLAEIVVVTHDVKEGDFRQALTEIESLDAIASIPSIIRVL